MTKRVLAVLCLVLLVAGCDMKWGLPADKTEPFRDAMTDFCVSQTGFNTGAARALLALEESNAYQDEQLRLIKWKYNSLADTDTIRVLSYTTTVLAATYYDYAEAVSDSTGITVNIPTTNHPACKIHKITYGTTDKPLFVIKSQELLEGLPKPWETWDYYSGGETWIESVQE